MTVPTPDVPEWTGIDEAYRARLARLRTRAFANYDKAVITLSGGALGISFAFVKDAVGRPDSQQLRDSVAC